MKLNFDSKEKIKPFRFSITKMKEILDSWKNFLFVSWAPDFIFDIYLELLKNYIIKNIWKSESNNIFWFWSNVCEENKYICPLWSRDSKTKFINSLKEKNIIKNSIWWMWDTWSDFGISDALDKWNDFFFINPEKKVIEKFDELKSEWINYKIIIERKDLVCEINKENIKFIN